MKMVANIPGKVKEIKTTSKGTPYAVVEIMAQEVYKGKIIESPEPKNVFVYDADVKPGSEVKIAVLEQYMAAEKKMLIRYDILK